LLGAVTAGVVLDHTHAYRPLLKLGFVLAGAAMVAIGVLQRPNAFGLLAGECCSHETPSISMYDHVSLKATRHSAGFSAHRTICLLLCSSV
jgi:hypothetical protein